MQSLAPGMLMAYRKLVNDGFAADFGRALQIGQEQAQTVNTGVTCELIEARR